MSTANLDKEFQIKVDGETLSLHGQQFSLNDVYLVSVTSWRNLRHVAFAAVPGFALFLSITVYFAVTGDHPTPFVLAMQGGLLLSAVGAFLAWELMEEKHSVVLRCLSGATFVGSFPKAKETADKLAEMIAETIQSYQKGAIVALLNESTCGEIVLAGNDASVAKEQLVSGGRSYPLKFAVNSVVEGVTPVHWAGKIRFPLRFAQRSLTIVGVAILCMLTSVLTNNLSISVVSSLMLLLMFGTVALFAMRFVFFYVSFPPLWTVSIIEVSSRRCVYKSESEAQAKWVEQRIRIAMNLDNPKRSSHVRH